MSTLFLLTIKDLSNALISLILIIFILSTLLVVVKFFTQHKNLTIDKNLSRLYIAFSLMSIVQYVLIISAERSLMYAYIRYLFMATELLFLTSYISIIFENNFTRARMLSPIILAFIFLLIGKFQLWLNESILTNLYYVILSLIIPSSIFIFLIRIKDEHINQTSLKKPLILISLGILTCYLLRVNVNTSFAIIQLYQFNYLIKPVHFFSCSISLLTIIEMISLIMLNIFMYRATDLSLKQVNAT